MSDRPPTSPPPTSPAEDSSGGYLVHILRPRASVILGGFAIVACLGLALLSLNSGLTFVAGLALAAAAAFVLLVRPHVRVSIEGVAVHNPVRRTFVPWRLLDDVGSRWNLELYAAERTITAWAISSHIDRPTASGLSGLGGLGGLGGAGGVGGARTPDEERSSTTSPPERPSTRSPFGPAVTAPRAARLIETSRVDWETAVRDAVVFEPPDPRIVRSWDLLDVAVLAVPAAALVIGLLN